MCPQNQKDYFSLFISAAEKFCDLIDNRTQFKQREFLLATANQLAQLYKLGIELPDVESDSDSGLKEPLSSTEWNELYKSLGEYLGKLDHYIQMFDPTEINEKEPVGSSLSDDLADIYRDLKRGLFNRYSYSENDLIWDWRLHFKVHWGNHLTSALSAIHHQLFKGIDHL